MKIVDVRATTCDVPVPRPIVMGDLRYDTRDYIVVEIVTDEGVSGFGFGMARYAPIAEVIERNLKPLLVGKDPLMTEQHWDRMYNLNLLIAGRGIFMRALSVVDIALWDIKGKAAGLPIWRLIGGHRTRMPVLVAGGYIAADRGLDYLGKEVADYVARGFRKFESHAVPWSVPLSRYFQTLLLAMRVLVTVMLGTETVTMTGAEVLLAPELSVAVAVKV